MNLIHFIESKDDNGEYLYPLLRDDVSRIRARSASELLSMTNRAIMAESERDSLEVVVLVNSLTNDREWYDNLEIGILAGVLIAVSTGWAIGQVAH